MSEGKSASAGRPGWDEYYMSIARTVASRSSCIRRRVGALIVVLVSYSFHQDSLRVQGILTGLLTASLVLVLLLVYALNQPFTGLVPISKQPLLHATTQFEAIDLPLDVPAPQP